MIQAGTLGQGERWLWFSVLALAVDDLNSRNARQSEAARAWLFGDPAADLVCRMAGVDPDWLRSAILRAGLIQEQRTAA